MLATLVAGYKVVYLLFCKRCCENEANTCKAARSPIEVEYERGLTESRGVRAHPSSATYW